MLEGLSNFFLSQLHSPAPIVLVYGRTGSTEGAAALCVRMIGSCMSNLNVVDEPLIDLLDTLVVETFHLQAVFQIRQATNRIRMDIRGHMHGLDHGVCLIELQKACALRVSKLFKFSSLLGHDIALGKVRHKVISVVDMTVISDQRVLST